MHVPAQQPVPTRHPEASAKPSEQSTTVQQAGDAAVQESQHQVTPAPTERQAQPADPGKSGPGVDPKTGKKYLYKTDTYMVLSENPTVIQAIPKKPTPEELEAWKKERESVPLVTEVMTEEELRAYMKEKNIPLIAKDNFRPPELVWERRFEELVYTIDSVSDITEGGNSIFRTGGLNDKRRSLLFLDPKGQTRRQFLLDEEGGENAFFAMSGKAAVISKSEGTMQNEGERCVSVAYLNEFGERLWKKERLCFPSYVGFYISYEGNALALIESNPYWGGGEWRTDKDLNGCKIHFLDNYGNIIMEYSGFRNLAIGCFSGDGNYFAGIFFWQNNMAEWGKLLYFDLRQHKIIWERSFGRNVGSIWYEDNNYLKVSEHGSFIAVTNIGEFEDSNGGEDPYKSSEISVINRAGELVSDFKGIWINDIRDDNKIDYFKTMDQMRAIGDAKWHKSIKETSQYMCLLAYNMKNMLIFKATYDKSSKEWVYSIFDLLDKLLWEQKISKMGVFKITVDGKYLKGIGITDFKENSSLEINRKDRIVYFRLP